MGYGGREGKARLSGASKVGGLSLAAQSREARFGGVHVHAGINVRSCADAQAQVCPHSPPPPHLLLHVLASAAPQLRLADRHPWARRALALVPAQCWRLVLARCCGGHGPQLEFEVAVLGGAVRAQRIRTSIGTDGRVPMFAAIEIKISGPEYPEERHTACLTPRMLYLAPNAYRTPALSSQSRRATPPSPWVRAGVPSGRALASRACGAALGGRRG